jgi:hypothetical protein
VIDFVLNHLDWVLGFLAIAQKLCTLRKIWWAPIFGAAAQAPWLGYILYTEQYGFLLLTGMLVIMNISYIKKWYHERNV